MPQLCAGIMYLVPSVVVAVDLELVVQPTG